MLWTVLACCCTAATSCASSSVCWAQPHSHSTRFCIPHLLERSTRVPKIIARGVWRMFGDSMLRIYLAGEVAAERGEQLLREGDLPGRQGRLAFARRPYLVGEDAPWVRSRRDQLHGLLVRGRDCGVEALLWNGEVSLALDQARGAVGLEPYRESGYRRLVQVLVRKGDRGEAIRVYNNCRRLLADELGVAPSSETETFLRSLTG